MTRRFLWLCLLGAACGAPLTTDDQPVEGDSTEVLDETDVLPPMPAFPPTRAGHLTAVGVGQHPIDGAWAARAGLCDKPAMLQVIAEVTGTGTLILLQLPGGERVGHYPVAITQSGMPEPPAAQIGVQLFRDDGAFAFQAAEGDVELTGLDGEVSGRFAVTLRNIQTAMRTQYAGVFDRVRVERLPAEYCTRLEEAMGTSEDPVGVR